MPEEKAIGVPL